MSITAWCLFFVGTLHHLRHSSIDKSFFYHSNLVILLPLRKFTASLESSSRSSSFSICRATKLCISFYYLSVCMQFSVSVFTVSGCHRKATVIKLSVEKSICHAFLASCQRRKIPRKNYWMKGINRQTNDYNRRLTYPSVICRQRCSGD